MSDTTIDGYPVTVGMIVWDYDLRLARVGEPQRYGNPSEPVWYDMTRPDGARSSMMDAKRMRARHPSSGQLASEAAKATS